MYYIRIVTANTCVMWKNNSKILRNKKNYMWLKKKIFVAIATLGFIMAPSVASAQVEKGSILIDPY